jgi:hypothetical protein
MTLPAPFADEQASNSLSALRESAANLEKTERERERPGKRPGVSDETLLFAETHALCAHDTSKE